MPLPPSSKHKHSAAVAQHLQPPVAAESTPASQAVTQMREDGPSPFRQIIDPSVTKSMQVVRVILAGPPAKVLCEELDVRLKEAHAGIRKLQRRANQAVRDGTGNTFWTGQVFAIALEYQELRDYAEEWQHHANLSSKQPCNGTQEAEDAADDGVDTPSFALQEALALQEKATQKVNVGAMKRHKSSPDVRNNEDQPLETPCSNPGSELFLGRGKEESRHRPVELAMYDLSRGIAKWVPALVFDGNHFEAIWHTGVRVFGFEFWFGGDIIQAIPDVMPFGNPVRIVRLGMTQRKYKELRRFIRDELAVVYTRQSYDALRQNCNHFSNEVVRFLLHGKQIPQEVRTQLEWCRNAAVVKALRPMLTRWLGGSEAARGMRFDASDLSTNSGALAPGAYPIVHPSLSPKLLHDQRFASTPRADAGSSCEEDESPPRHISGSGEPGSGELSLPIGL